MYAIVRTSVHGINDDLSLNVTEQEWDDFVGVMTSLGAEHFTE